jgi:hypothetical protein
MAAAAFFASSFSCLIEISNCLEIFLSSAICATFSLEWGAAKRVSSFLFFLNCALVQFFFGFGFRTLTAPAVGKGLVDPAELIFAPALDASAVSDAEAVLSSTVVQRDGITTILV